MANRNEIALARKMQEEGYTQKQIRLVTKIPQSTLSRIMNMKTHVMIKPKHYDSDVDLDRRLENLNKFLTLKEIAGDIGLDDDNKKYIKTLQYLGVKLKDVQEHYYDISKSKLRAEWDYNNVNFREFNSELIGVSREEFLELISL